MRTVFFKFKGSQGRRKKNRHLYEPDATKSFHHFAILLGNKIMKEVYMGSIKYLQCITLTAAFSVSFLIFSTTSIAQQKQFDRFVVFGTSLSDSGNAFVLLSDPSAFGFSEDCDMGTPANVPPYDALDDLLIPDGSYARGGHHVTNGATWVEQLARGKGLSGNTRPASRNPGKAASNYAVGGARASDYPCRFNLENQVNAYLTDFPETSADTLVVLEIGSNDVRDALASAAMNPTQSSEIIATALNNVGIAVNTLYTKGARKFLLMNVPAVGETPAVKTLDSWIPGTAFAADTLAESFNFGLATLQSTLNSLLPEIDIRILDIYSLLYEIIGDPASYGIVNTEDACVTPNLPPFTCKKPDTYLFWDGIHPTKVVHDIVAQKAAEVIN
jgi:phospholipase/lecithinase/hemolysin